MNQCGVPQGSVLGPFLFLIYINDLSDNLISNAKLFADDTSLFSVVHDVNTSAKELNDDLKKVNDWAFQWKMSFNPDPSKQDPEVIFSRKLKRSTALFSCLSNLFSKTPRCHIRFQINVWRTPQ